MNELGFQTQSSHTIESSKPTEFSINKSGVDLTAVSVLNVGSAKEDSKALKKKKKMTQSSNKNPSKKEFQTSVGKLLSSKNDDSKEKQEIIYTIRKYQENERFKKYITKDLGITFTYSALNKKSVSSLNDILNKIRVSLDNRNSSKMMDAMAKNFSVVYEKVVSEFYDIDGFTDTLWSQENFLDSLEKMKIETKIPQIPTPIQVAFIVLQTTVMTHEINKIKEAQVGMKPPPDLVIEDL